jgi:DNA topoisomerase VI subunit A
MTNVMLVCAEGIGTRAVRRAIDRMMLSLR